MKPGTDTGAAADLAPIFTDTTSSNLGLPKNPMIPFYYENKPDFFGFTPNPAGNGFTDLGVGLFLRGLSGVNPNAGWTKFAPDFDGFMQVATARDVGLRPASPNFVKAYMHNGYLKSLKEVVHFYNTTSSIAPLGLTPQEEDDLVAYMEALYSGELHPSLAGITPCSLTRKEPP